MEKEEKILWIILCVLAVLFLIALALKVACALHFLGYI